MSKITINRLLNPVEGEGWEANSQYHESIEISRRTNPDVPNGNLDPEKFGIWTDLAECLKDVLFLVEAQAYFKEVQNMPHRYSHVDTNFPPVEDDGTENGKIRQKEKILAGAEIGRSDFWMKKTKDILTRIGAEDHDRSVYDLN